MKSYNYTSLILAFALHYSLFFFVPSPLYAQRKLSLFEAVEFGQHQSSFYHIAKKKFEIKYKQFRNYKAKFNPQLRLNLGGPTYFREISPIVQPDGSINFIRVSQANASIGLNITQQVGLTGGTLVAGTRLQSTNNFLGNQNNVFLLTPFTISYQQNSFLYNEMHWINQIEPILFEAAKKEFSEEMEACALQVASLFLDVLYAQVILDNANRNLAVNDTLYNLSKERFSLGTISHNELLQLELNVLKAKNLQNESFRTFKVNELKLKNILNIDLNDSLILQVPTFPPNIAIIDYIRAKNEAFSNRKFELEFRTKRLQADQELAKIKSQNKVVFNLVANVGTQQSSSKLSDSFNNLQNQQYISVSFDIPILDWGLSKSEVSILKANRDLLEINLTQDALNFEQEIYTLVLQYNSHGDRLNLNIRADNVAQERLKTTKARYLLGKIAITDLNFALQESVNARDTYINTLRSYWISYYLLRRLTLFDFIKNEPITYKPE